MSDHSQSVIRRSLSSYESLHYLLPSVKQKREETVNLRAKQSLANAVSEIGKEGFCSRFCAAVGIGSIAKRDVFCCALFDQVLNPCDQ